MTVGNPEIYLRAPLSFRFVSDTLYKGGQMLNLLISLGFL